MKMGRGAKRSVALALAVGLGLVPTSSAAQPPEAWAPADEDQAAAAEAEAEAEPVADAEAEADPEADAEAEADADPAAAPEAEAEADADADTDPAPEAGKAEPAQGRPAPGGAVPTLRHAPVSTARAHEALSIHADIVYPQLVKRALLVYRPAKQKGFEEVEFRRGAPGPYVAVVPGDHVASPGLHYTIELERIDGARQAVFSSRAEPYRVQIPEDGMDAIEQAQSQRVEDRRSVFSSRAEYVSFGRSVAAVERSDGQLVDEVVDDWYYRVEGGYTYRPLRTISEFSIRVGVVRGSAPVPVRELQPGQSEDERFDVGLNYGAATVRFRMHDLWHVDGSVLANVTEVGFSAGTGATLHIGDLRGSKLSLGFEAIETFGLRFFTQVDIRAHDRVRVSPIIEATNAPSADDFGVRLLGEVGWDIGYGFAVAGRGGYQARDATSGGPAGGGTVSYAF